MKMKRSGANFYPVLYKLGNLMKMLNLELQFLFSGFCEVMHREPQAGRAVREGHQSEVIRVFLATL